MDYLKSIVFDWKLPYFLVIKKYLVYVALLSFLVFFFPREFKEFWEHGWNILLIIVFSRPLADILPKLWILKKLVILRKELWIISGALILAHGIWYFLALNIPFNSIFSPFLWRVDSHLTRWLLWIIVMLPVLITSNLFSIKVLWKWWKKVQKLTYLFFIFWAIHIALVSPDSQFEMIAYSISLWIVWILAHKKIVLWK